MARNCGRAETRRFSPGDHLQVRRRHGYNHHGIYISDNRVIQFGSGITLTDKSRTGIDAVPLHDFENGGIAKVVHHGAPRTYPLRVK